MKTRSPVLVMLATVLLAGCDVVGPSERLGQFVWEEVENIPVTEHTEIVPARTEVLFLGELNAPTACFALTADVEASGSRLTLRVNAKHRDRPACEEREAAYRYHGVLRRMGGFAELRVVHTIQGGTETVYTHVLTPAT